MGTSAGLSPEAWAEGALALIAEAGVEVLSVEALARRLEVTKGSFYWHFSSRSALLLVALARWEKLDQERLRADLASVPEARARLRRLLWRGGDPLLDRFLASADLNVQRLLQRFRDRRLEMLAEVYGELGLTAAESRRWAALAYAAFVGLTRLQPEDAEQAAEMLLPRA